MIIDDCPNVLCQTPIYTGNCNPHCIEIREKEEGRAEDERMNRNVYASSKTDLWETPQDFFNELNARWHFTTDVCALPENAKCEHYYTPEQDGLKQEWNGVCWCNPPYGREIGKWIEKAVRSMATVVMLLPARTDTRWFHDWILPYGDIEFIRGRLKFGGAANAAPFPSMIVVFDPENKKP